MRALIRARTLLAICALFVLMATPSAASKVGKPIDGPEGPPMPDPINVGDPDQPPDLVTFVFGGRVFLFHLPRGVARPIQGLMGAPATPRRPSLFKEHRHGR
jgi:hypothetical protein